MSSPVVVVVVMAVNVLVEAVPDVQHIGVEHLDRRKCIGVLVSIFGPESLHEDAEESADRTDDTDDDRGQGVVHTGSSEVPGVAERVSTEARVWAWRSITSGTPAA
jgi:hypothetical protein